MERLGKELAQTNTKIEELSAVAQDHTFIGDRSQSGNYGKAERWGSYVFLVLHLRIRLRDSNDYGHIVHCFLLTFFFYYLECKLIKLLPVFGIIVRRIGPKKPQCIRFHRLISNQVFVHEPNVLVGRMKWCWLGK